MSVAEFHSLSDALPNLPGNIQAVRFFSVHGEHSRISVAVATLGKRTGWQIFILDSISNKNFKLG